MQFLVFRRADAALLVVPTVFQPPLVSRAGGELVPLGEYDLDLDALDPGVALDLGMQGYAVVRGEDWANLEVALQLTARSGSAEARPEAPEPDLRDPDVARMAIQQAASTLMTRVYERRDGSLEIVVDSLRGRWQASQQVVHYEVGEARLDLAALSGGLLYAIARQGHASVHGRDRDVVLRSITRWAEPGAATARQVPDTGDVDNTSPLIEGIDDETGPR